MKQPLLLDSEWKTEWVYSGKALMNLVRDCTSESAIGVTWDYIGFSVWNSVYISLFRRVRNSCIELTKLNKSRKLTT